MRINLLVVARAVNQLGAFSLAFLTVLLARSFGASLAEAGAISAAFGVATIPSRLLGGRLADRLGRRRTILIGLFGCAAAQLGIASAPNLAVAAGSAVLLGLTFELYEPPSQAAIADVVAENERAAAFSLLTTAMAVGNMGAGLVADFVGQSNLRWLFVVDAASCLACAAIVIFALPRDRNVPLQRASAEAADVADVAREISPWRDRRLLALTAAGTVFALVYMLMLISLPLSLAADRINPAKAGLVVTVSTVSLVLGRPLLHRRSISEFSDGAAFAAGYALMALGLAGYVPAHTLASYFLPTVAWSLGNLLLAGRAFAVVTRLAPVGATARYLAVYGLSWGFATMAAPMLGAWLIGGFGPGSLWAAMSAVCGFMALAQPVLLGRLAPRHEARPSHPLPRARQYL